MLVDKLGQVVDALIFDVDGTLWDSVDTCVEAWNQVLDTHSKETKRVDRPTLQGLFGKPMDVIFQNIFPGMPAEEIDRLSNYCIEAENILLDEKPGISYPRVKEVLKNLSKHARLFIVSNCQSGYVEHCMSALDIEGYIEDFACFGDNPVSKGQNIMAIMEKYDLQHPVYVGDTAGDAAACEEAEIPMIFASYGFGKVEEPWMEIASFSELENMVK